MNFSVVSLPVVLLQLNARPLVPPYVLAALGGVTLNNFCKHPPFLGKNGEGGSIIKMWKKGVRGKTIDSIHRDSS